LRFRAMRLLVLAMGLSWVASGEDVKEIFRRAVEKDQRNYTVRDQYTFREESTVEFLEKDGRTKSVQRETKEVLFFDGTQLDRVVARDGQPVSEREARGRRADQLKKFEGEACVDKATSDWMRMELATTDTISFGLFLFRLQPGATVRVEQTRVNNEVCFPSQVDVVANARVLGMMRRVRLAVRYSDFRKFAADSTITFETGAQ
jgi:hypothetical protein